MEHAMTEMPLALFTTLAPISAGSFFVLVLAFFTTKFSDEQLKKIDKFIWIPFVVLVAGFIAAFFHLTQPLNAIGVFTGLGRSPLSNEVLVGVIFAALAFVYCVLASAGKLSASLRKTFGAVLALVAIVFAIFVGLAYMIGTISSWNTVLVPLSVLGFFLLGGGLLGILVLALSGALAGAAQSSFKMIALIVLVLGFILGVGAAVAHIATVNGLSSLVLDPAALTSEVLPFFVVSVLAAFIALACGCAALLKKSSVTLVLMGVVVIVVAVLLARLVFYALQVSVGL